MALFLKNKNLFHKLAPLWAVLVTALYFFGCWYAYFYSASTEAAYYFNTYVKYVIWIVYEIIFFFSFAANNATEFARHVMYYFLAAAAGTAVLYFWIEKVFEPDMSQVYWQIVYYLDGSYHLNIFRNITVNSIGLALFGGVLCALKYKKNNGAWIRKHMR
ncbi:hypothetical protein [Ruminococcus sp. Marseille-P6503]|uniref:hypothetical protein n=1 Tax=Ruminococcus sp. Marseille-P6503 TaxID=2364796 RepID=UPI000F539C4C|nr:hypothetical protein [Ruminococcus sp. Marseille-P6503]